MSFSECLCLSRSSAFPAHYCPTQRGLEMENPSSKLMRRKMPMGDIGPNILRSACDGALQFKARIYG